MTNRKPRVSKHIVFILLIVLLAASGVYYAFKSGTDTFGTKIRKINSGEAYAQSATKFDSVETKYTPKLKPGENHIRQLFKVQDNGLNAIKVRIRYKNGKEIGDLTFELKDEAGTAIKTYVVDASKIENWKYVTFPLNDLSLQKGDTYSVEIYMTEDQESAQYNFYLSGMNIDENIQLYCDDTPIDGQLDIVYTYESIYYLTDWQGMVSVLVVMLFMFLDSKRYSVLKIKKIWLPLMLAFEAGCFIVIVMIVEELSLGGLAEMQFTAILVNICVCACLYMLILLITNSRSTSMILTAVLLFILALINHYTLLCRGTVLLPSDIYSINTAADVVGAYSEKIKVDSEVLYTFRMLCILTAGCIWFFRGRNKSRRVVSAAVFLILGFANYTVFTMKSVQKFLNTEVSSWNMTDRSHEIGFLLNAGEGIQYGMLTKPEGYDADRVAQLLDNAEPVKAQEDEKPVNIIAIMNESFSDLRNIGVENTNEPFLTRFDEIANGDNCVSGKLVMPVYGAGTSCSEFEFLTGCSMLFLSAGNAPYQQYIHKETDSLASYLKNEGYSTLAMHPNKATSWFRNSAYPKIGFERFISIEDDEMQNLVKCRNWTDDTSFVNVMVEETEKSDNELFEFNVTMQNHGGYIYAGDNFRNRITVEGYEDTEGQVSQYLTLISMSDEAFGSLIDQLKASDEKTLVVMFGDHLPNLPEEFYSQYFENDGYYLNNLKMYETPYIIWANYDIEMPDVPEVLSSNFLAPYVLQTAGEELTGYYAYLYNLSQQYPIVSSHGIYDSNMTQYKYEESSPCYETIHDYEMVQYSRLK